MRDRTSRPTMDAGDEEEEESPFEMTEGDVHKLENPEKHIDPRVK